MVCALHRLFQSESDDRVMEHGFDPGPEHPPRLKDGQRSQGPETGDRKAGILRRLTRSTLRHLARKPARPAG